MVRAKVKVNKEKKIDDFSSLLSSSWDFFNKKIWLIIILSLIFYVIPQALGNLLYRYKFGFENVFENITSFASLIAILKEVLIYFVPYIIILGLLSIFFTATIIMFLQKKEEKITLSTSLSNGKKIFLKLFNFSIVSVILLILLYLLFIIPGIIFSIYWVISVYIFIFEKKDIMTSLKTSKDRIKGKWWKVFGYMLLLLIIYFGVIIFVGVATLPLSEILLNSTNFNLNLFIESILVLINSFINALFNAFSIIFYYNLYLSLSKKV